MPVAERRAKAQKKLEKLRKSGMQIKPVTISGGKIARTFWGRAWCDHLESFSDYENRLPRGRTYVRNGSVCHLEISKGLVSAMVAGSQLYRVEVRIKTLAAKRWTEVKNRCAGQIGSVLELLQGKLSKNVMSVVADRDGGLFPRPEEIAMECSCPDWASMCKHLAAVLYAVGARLDESPELLFLLRGVDHEELIGAQIDLASASPPKPRGGRRIADDALSEVFGIDIAETAEAGPPERARGRRSPEAAVPDREGIPRSAAPPGAIGADEILRLREKLALTKAGLARLLGVSPATVGNWEKSPGPLTLRSRTSAALAAAKKLTKAQARRKLEELS